MTMHYLATQSATRFIQQDEKRVQIQQYIMQANSLNQEYEVLNKRQKDLFFARQISNIHQKNIQAASGTKPYLNTAFWDFQNQKQEVVNYQQIQQWLTSLHHWAIRGYKVIVRLRKTITGQELIYHIQDTNNSFSYTLNESQYLKLLAGNNISMTYASTSSLDAVINQGLPMGDLFKLSVGATQSKIQNISDWSQKKGQGEIQGASLKNDVLYQYLLQNGGVIKTKNGGTSHARIYELHSQLVAAYEWKRNTDGSIAWPDPNNKSKFFFSKHRENAVSNFVKKYIDAQMHKDNIAFYKTGDAIQNERVLIENKVGNAVVSISTIHNAIKNIASWKNIASVAELKQAFINMFTHSGNKSFEKKIQDGARKFATKQIRELFKSS